MMTEHRALRLTFPQVRVREPIIYQMGMQFEVVTSIRRAEIRDHLGWMVLEMSGEPTQLDAAETYLRTLGIEVVSALGDIVEG